MGPRRQLPILTQPAGGRPRIAPAAHGEGQTGVGRARGAGTGPGWARPVGGRARARRARSKSAPGHHTPPEAHCRGQPPLPTRAQMVATVAAPRGVAASSPCHTPTAPPPLDLAAGGLAFAHFFPWLIEALPACTSALAARPGREMSAALYGLDDGPGRALGRLAALAGALAGAGALGPKVGGGIRQGGGPVQAAAGTQWRTTLAQPRPPMPSSSHPHRHPRTSWSLTWATLRPLSTGERWRRPQARPRQPLTPAPPPWCPPWCPAS